jgi:hypothetical protein
LILALVMLVDCIVVAGMGDADLVRGVLQVIGGGSPAASVLTRSRSAAAGARRDRRPQLRNMLLLVSA